MKKFLVFSAALLILTSCQKIEKKIQGNWIIEEATYQNQDILDILRYNVLSIEMNGTCKTPVIKKENSFSRDAIWNIEKKDGRHYLIINSDIPTWNQKFQISFKERIQGDAKIPEIYLQSENMFLKASK